MSGENVLAAVFDDGILLRVQCGRPAVTRLRGMLPSAWDSARVFGLGV